MYNIIYYTNCQYRGLHYFLQKSIKNIKYTHLENYTLIKNKQTIPIDIMKQADIFIYQPIDKKYGIYSTDTIIENNIMSYLPLNCKKISVPYIFHSSLWVFALPAYGDIVGGRYSDFEYIGRESIINLKANGYSLAEVLQLYSNGEIDFEYQNRFNKSIEILKKKEEICDIKVSEFIEKNIRKHKLFYSCRHPTTCVFIHCVNQVLSILEYNDKYDEFSYPEDVSKIGSGPPHSSYDEKYWNFEYNNYKVDDNWYVNHIINIYNQ